MNWDQQLFYWINQMATHSFLDGIMPFLRNGPNWIPLYILLVAVGFWRWGWRAVFWLLLVVATVGIVDGTSNYAFKKTIERPRPCHVEAPVEARLLVECGSGFSFTSSHAANHMALALIIGWTLFRGLRWARGALLLWALSIGYAQIYVGVHYPADVLAGFVLGGCVASLGIWVWRKWLSRQVARFGKLQADSQEFNEENQDDADQ